MLWFLAEPEKLPDSVIADLNEAAPAPLFSAVSIWEVAIKQSLGRADFKADAETVRAQLLLAGWQELAFTGMHAAQIASLPNIHKDPFDRALLAQALVEEAVLLTSDAILASYPGPVRQV